jgi:hypothetical protein
VARLTAAFVAGGVEVPLGLKPKTAGRDVEMKASTIETQLKTLTKNNVVVLVDPAAFAAFRVTHEATAVAAVAAEPMDEGERTPFFWGGKQQQQQQRSRRRRLVAFWPQQVKRGWVIERGL